MLDTDQCGFRPIEISGETPWVIRSSQDLEVGVMKDPCGWSLRGLGLWALVEGVVTLMVAGYRAVHYAAGHSTLFEDNPSHLPARHRRCSSALALVAGSVSEIVLS
jgi:hypothetical protein